MAAEMKRVSTHILDLAEGKPAPNVPVRLERQEGSANWRVLATASTDHDGRCAPLLSNGDDLSPGVYKLVFDTGSYYDAQKIDGLYPVVEVTFRVKKGQSHFHIPLLLSPNGYTTYRGS
jgi:5-hydroxyisourate hydrolase